MGLGLVFINEVDMAINQDLKALYPNAKIDNNYLLWALASKSHHLEFMGTGTTVKGIRIERLKLLKINLFKLKVQKRIASILSTFEYLIKNNLKRIKTIEELTMSIYQKWFINFRFPGYKDVKFENTKFGRMPEQWLAPLSEHVDFLEGPGLRKWQYRKSGTPFLNIRTLIPNDIDLSKVQYLDSHEVEKSYKHFLLKPLDHVVSSSGTIGRISTIQDIHLPLMLNTSIIRMRSISNKVGTWQLKNFLYSSYFQNQINAFAIGVAQKNFGPLHLKQMWIVAPDKKIAQLYEQIVKPQEKLILNLVRQNRILYQERDLLLRGLISGKINISKINIKIDNEAA